MQYVNWWLYIMWLYLCKDTCLLSSDNTSGLVHSKAGSELNRFVQTLNLKITTINYDKTVLIAFLTYNLLYSRIISKQYSVMMNIVQKVQIIFKLIK